MALLLPWLTSGTGSGLRHGRVVLEPPRRDHFGQWARLRAVSRQHLEPFEPEWASDELSRKAYRRRLRRYRMDRLDGACFAYFVLRLADRQLVGGVTLSNVRRGVTQSASVGYWTGAPFVRQGYASDALAAILEFAFCELALNRVEAACMPHNAPSIGVLERAGFRREGHARNYLKINGAWEDHLLFACLRDDYLVSGEASAMPARPASQLERAGAAPDTVGLRGTGNLKDDAGQGRAA